MHQKKYDDTKKEIRSVLLTYQSSVVLGEFLKAYRGLVGQRLPSRELGFSTDVEFLQSMPDVVDLTTHSDGQIHLTGIADKTSQHIQKLVKRQRNPRASKTKDKQHKARQPVSKSFHTSFPTKELKPFLPGELKAEIIRLMSTIKNSVTLPAFVSIYYQTYKKYLPLVNGLDTLEAMINLIPELEVRNENNEKKIYVRAFLRSTEDEKRSHSKNGFIPGLAMDDKSTAQEEKLSNIHKSGIPDDVLKDFQMILQRCSDGIQNVHFPPLYENVTGKPFDLHELGYISLADLVEALPHIFKRVSNRDDEHHWLIYPAKSPIKQNLKGKKASVDSPLKNLPHREGIPADVSSPTLQFIQATIPDCIDLNQYIPVFVSAIIDPSLFWFHLQTDEFIENFEKLERDLTNFYMRAGDKYKMNSGDIAIGATCVIQNPDDSQWYRAVIKEIPSADLINVSFVDYGSRDNVPRNNLYYVWSEFHDYPAYAFKAQLAGIKPPGNANSWSIQAQKRFVQLCLFVLMAFVKPIDKDTYSVYLCDTNGDIDIHLNDTLVTEGHAEVCYESQFDMMNSSSKKPEDMHNGNNITLDSEGSSSVISKQDDSPSNYHEASPKEDKLSVCRKLSFSIEEDINGMQPNSSHFISNKKPKRCVKVVELCDESKIHLINLNDQLFMSCTELCNLLWCDKNVKFLLKGLMHKEIQIPFLHVKKEEYVELYQQCSWHKIPGFDNLNSENSPVILCPLECAFNILNIFGHPSVCLRIIIQNELKSFNPHDEFWNEFFHEDSPDLSDIESIILEEKLNKLCLYDLKIKYESLKIHKLKLLRTHSVPPTKEIKRIETLLDVITKRMKQIEAICTQYSTCS